MNQMSYLMANPMKIATLIAANSESDPYRLVKGQIWLV